MVYSTVATKRRAGQIHRTIDYGTKLILMIVGIGLYRSEFRRIVALPHELNNELYLVLLTAASLLTAGWIFVANREFDIMCDFLDPLEYEIPSETFIGLSIAGALSVLLYTARNPLWFGISYSIYMLISVVGWKRAIREMGFAIKGSRKNLEGEPKQKREIYGTALDVLEAYYVRQRNMPRVWTSFALGLAGFTCSIVASALGRPNLSAVAYLIFIVSIVLLEGGVAFYWRFKFYTQVRPLETAKHDFEHRKRRADPAGSVRRDRKSPR